MWVWDHQTYWLWVRRLLFQWIGKWTVNQCISRLWNSASRSASVFPPVERRRSNLDGLTWRMPKDFCMGNPICTIFRSTFALKHARYTQMRRDQKSIYGHLCLRLAHLSGPTVTSPETSGLSCSLERRPVSTAYASRTSRNSGDSRPPGTGKAAPSKWEKKM